MQGMGTFTDRPQACICPGGSKHTQQRDTRQIGQFPRKETRYGRYERAHQMAKRRCSEVTTFCVSVGTGRPPSSGNERGSWPLPPNNEAGRAMRTTPPRLTTEIAHHEHALEAGEVERRFTYDLQQPASKRTALLGVRHQQSLWLRVIGT